MGGAYPTAQSFPPPLAPPSLSWIIQGDLLFGAGFGPLIPFLIAGTGQMDMYGRCVSVPRGRNCHESRQRD